LTFCRITDKIVYGGIEVYFFTPMPIFYYKGGTVLGEHKTCYKCFKNYDIGLHVCPYCNHNEYSPHNPMYIKAGAKLNNRYIVGILLEYNGEGATYVALDTSTDCKVMIREYMPINLCTRVKDKTAISVNYNNLAKFKAFLAEYTDLNKSLARLRENTNINPILDMFEENNTWYTVFEYINGVKMLDYLKENAGELSWGQIAKLFPPLFTTMGILHNAGIIHRAISPDTVYINNKGELRLFGFSISAVRTANAGLEYELFRGYSAPEQYSADINSRQGSWTDVYGVCALMYRALTGCMPVDSQTRMSNDELCEPSMLNPTIPPSVSRTIMDGMKLKSSERIKNVTELVTRLFEQPVKPAPVPMNQNGNTRTMPSQNNYTPKNNYAPQQNNYVPPQNNYVPPQNNYVPPQNNYTTPLQPVYPNQTPPPYVQQNASSQQSNSGKEESENTVEKFKVPIIIGILLVSILMIISVIITNMITSTKKANEEAFMKKSSISNSSNSSPEEEEQTVTEAVTERFDTIMPDLVGKYYNITEQKYSEYLNFEVIYDYNDDFETDYIFEQNIKAGEQIASGSTVRVKVSKGKETAEIPKYSGLTADEYEEKLKEVGISNYSMIAMPTASSGTPNTVVQLQIGSKLVYPGTVFSNKEGSKLIIYYLPENVEILNGGSSGNSSSSSDNSSSGNSFNYQYATEASTSSSWSNFNWSIDGNSSNNSNNNNNNNNNNSSNGDNGSSGGDNSNTGGDSGSTGGDNSNTGGDSGSTGGDNSNTGGDSGSTGGDNSNTGGDSGSTGGDSGNAGGDGGNNSGGEVPEIDVSGGGDSGTV